MKVKAKHQKFIMAFTEEKRKSLNAKNKTKKSYFQFFKMEEKKLPIFLNTCIRKAYINIYIYIHREKKRERNLWILHRHEFGGPDDGKSMAGLTGLHLGYEVGNPMMVIVEKSRVGFGSDP